jgi:hypothetical protein
MLWSIETHRVKCLKQPSESKLNSMVGTSPASQNHSFAQDVYLERADPAACSLADRAHENLFQVHSRPGRRGPAGRYRGPAVFLGFMALVNLVRFTPSIRN